MVDNGQRTERSRDLERFLTFIDAVVAIAVTLLVLPLVDIVREVGENGSVVHLLQGHVSQLGAFVLSFTVIARFWLAQHHVVRTLVVQDRVVTTLMMAWMFTIVFLPFPTSLVAVVGSQAATKVLYVGTMALCSTLVALLSTHVARTPGIRDGGATGGQVVAWTTAALFAAALAVSLLVPESSYYPLLLLLLTGVVVRASRRVLTWRSGARARLVRRTASRQHRTDDRDG